ncbi:MAG: MXAN_6521/LA_1396 family lipoprotein [Leptospiraceae bacterium]|nr:MXAN_6521/LA_1396 family lipoprotein [Leptospiraceae bacterium]
MSILKNKYFFFCFLFLPFINCTVKFSKKSPNFLSKINSTKRIVIHIDKKSLLRKKESEILYDITKELISHHKEFIVYPEPENFEGKCDPNSPKMEGILNVLLIQKIENEEIFLSEIISLRNCLNETEIIWEAQGKDSFPMKSEENESLRKTYTQKYGREIEYAVNPYFLLTKIILEKLDSPELTEDEKDEKIDIESQ